MVIVIDPQVSGLAGNMFIGAFVDLGADEKKIKKVILDYAKEFGDIKIEISKKEKSGVMTTFANIETKDNTSRHFPEIIQKLDEITNTKYPEDTLWGPAVEQPARIQVL
jgi:uncharacterized protein (DUF111 family)